HILVDRLPGLLRQFEPDRLSSLLLTNGSSLHRVPIGSNVLDPEGDDITTAQLAVDGQVKHRQLANAAFDLQLRADCPDVLRTKRRLGADQLALIPSQASERGYRMVIAFLHGQ